MANEDFNVEEFLKINLKEMVFRVDGVDTGDCIVYDESKCTSCGGCALVCAPGIWAAPEGKKAKLSPKYKELCLECAACYAICEADAIDFKYPNGGSGIVIKHG